MNDTQLPRDGDEELSEAEALARHRQDDADAIAAEQQQKADIERARELKRGPLSLAAIMLLRLGCYTPEEIAVMDHDDKQQPELTALPLAIDAAISPAQISAAARQVAAALIKQQLDPARARAALYALQIATSAAHLDPASRKQKPKPRSDPSNATAHHSPKLYKPTSGSHKQSHHSSGKRKKKARTK